MYDMKKSDKSVLIEFSSIMKNIDRAIGDIQEYVKESTSLTCNNLKQVIRELLINAVEHGNKNEESKVVKCSVEDINNNRFKVTVEDQGDGFDYRNLNLSGMSNTDSERNRGMAIVNTYSDSVEFNEQGNVVFALVTIEKETSFDVVKENGKVLIKATGDISATVSEAFLDVTLNLISSGSDIFWFDFKSVHTIDSLSLSILLRFLKKISTEKPNAEIEVIGLNSDLHNLFKMTRIDKYFSKIEK